ncbi:cytochrome c-type biogenesis protein [Pseudoalteromonas sp.]|uniref:cytochrome c-type biogenesis protein n=1 Tax=Pseudoalteromonas sp. TaxID=53249 RepID=UPI00261B998E|nr:cytochrome c-type biogenesis protein [Pseudoalteromonas sp.]MCP4588779.1 cytochrome c-type biogenesis protein CcmH [Pseudoalteromonas sp.]
MKQLLALILLCLPLSLQAAIDTYEFDDEATRERFKQLTFELRCPKCQNQNLQDSNSPIAADLRNEVYKMLREGNDNDEIVDFMVARYGDFVLYRPPVNQMTYLLWYGPFVLVVIGLLVMFALSRKRKKVSDEGEDLESHLSNDEEQRLKKILDEGADK